MILTDVLLHCLGTSWELHRPYIQKSTVLSEILSKAEIKPHHQCYYRDPLTATVDRFISKSDYYSNEYRKLSRTLSITENKEDLHAPTEETKSIDHPSHLVEARRANMTKIKLKVRDQLVTKEGELHLVLMYSSRIPLGENLVLMVIKSKESIVSVMCIPRTIMCTGYHVI